MSIRYGTERELRIGILLKRAGERGKWESVHETWYQSVDDAIR